VSPDHSKKSPIHLCGCPHIVGGGQNPRSLYGLCFYPWFLRSVMVKAVCHSSALQRSIEIASHESHVSSLTESLSILRKTSFSNCYREWEELNQPIVEETCWKWDARRRSTLRINTVRKPHPSICLISSICFMNSTIYNMLEMFEICLKYSSMDPRTKTQFETYRRSLRRFFSERNCERSVH
jgi:hypothetical protein